MLALELFGLAGELPERLLGHGSEPRLEFGFPLRRLLTVRFEDVVVLQRFEPEEPLVIELDGLSLEQLRNGQTS